MERFSVKKPYTILVMVIVIIILGFVSLTSMTTDLLPRINLPYILVITTYPGASPEKVETTICEPMESALGSVKGVKNVMSVSNENYGIVELEFIDGTDMDSTMVKIASALDPIKDILPDECGTPQIMELGTDMLASMYVAVSYEGKEIEALSKFVENTVVPRLERQDGVTSISEIGLVEKTIQVELNQEKVTALNDKILALTDDKFADAVEQLDKAKEQLEESEKTIRDSKQKLIDSEQELEDGKQKLVDGQQELDDNKKKMEDSKRELDEAKKTLDETKEETFDMLAAGSELIEAVEAYRAELALKEAALEEIDKTIDGLGDIDYQDLVRFNDSYTQDEGIGILYLFEYRRDITDDKLDTVVTAEDLAKYQALVGRIGAKIDVSEIEALTAESKYNEAKDALGKSLEDFWDQFIYIDEDGMNKLIAGVAVLSTKYSLEADITMLKTAVSASEQALEEMGVSYKDIERGKMEAAMQFGSADAQLAAAKAQLEAGKAQLDAAQEQLDNGWDSLEEGEKQIQDGWEQLKDGEEQLSDGWKQYNDSVKQYEKQKAQALKKANANQLISLSTLSQLIYAQNFSMPAGYVDDKTDHAWLVKMGENYKSLEDLSNVLLTKIDDIGDVRLCDVADLTIIDNSEDSYAKLDHEKAVILSIFKGSTAGTNEVSKQVHKEIEALETEFPGLKIFTMMDQGDYITLIINSVLNNILIGALLAIVVLALFLKDIKPTLVVAVSIPLSVLTALVLMYFTNISLNMMSLSGLALGIGMLVDNSIVVIENIYRLRSKGVSAARAAVQGTKQVAGSIVASTLTTVCVFFPLVFTTGMVRDLIMPISLTIIYTLGASLVIAMTVVPAAGSTLLRNAKEKKHPWFDKIQDIYGASLAFCLKVKILPLFVAIGLLAVCIWQVMRMGIVMFPDMTSTQIQASVSMPEEWDRDTCYAAADEMIEKICNIEGVESVGTMSGGEASLFSSAASNANNFDRYSIMVTMENENAGQAEVKRVSDEIYDICAIDGCEASVSSGMGEMSSMMGGSGLGINIYGTDLDTLKSIGDDLTELINSVEGFDEVTTGEEDPDKVIHLIINKDDAMRYGLSVAQMFAEINSKISSTATAATVTIDDYEMEIVIIDDRDPLTKENLLNYNFELQVTDEDGDSILEDHTLGEFAKEEIRDGVTSVNRRNQSRYITLTAMPEEGYNVTLLARDLEPLIDNYELPDGYKIEMGGEYDTVLTMIGQMSKVLALGLALIYLVMVAQFQSLLSPFIVIFTVPLAFTGGLLGLWGAGETLSMTGLLGFVILMGTVVNNGIVFVDYANQLRMGGMERRMALVATGKTRMRPILMTALTTILAMSTMLFGDDMASQMSKGMALVIIGGLVYATLMTLYIIPVMYDILFKRPPMNIDLGDENIDDVLDDAADYIASMRGSEEVAELEEPAEAEEVEAEPAETEEVEVEPAETEEAEAESAETKDAEVDE